MIENLASLVCVGFLSRIGVVERSDELDRCSKMALE